MFEKLLADLRGFWHWRRRAVALEFKRSLPLADYVVDRWEKARDLGFGRNRSRFPGVQG